MRIRSFAGAFALVLSAATAATAAGLGGPSMPSGYIDVHGGVLSGWKTTSIPTAASPFRRRRREERYAPPCPSPRTYSLQGDLCSTATISRAAPPVRRGPEELARTPRGTRRGATSWAYWFRLAATATGIAERSRTSGSRRFTSGLLALVRPDRADAGHQRRRGQFCRQRRLRRRSGRYFINPNLFVSANLGADSSSDNTSRFDNEVSWAARSSSSPTDSRRASTSPIRATAIATR